MDINLTINKNALINLTNTYADNYIKLQKDYDYCDDVDYLSGYCTAVESWMNALGISPQSNFVQEIIYNKRINN